MSTHQATNGVDLSIVVPVYNSEKSLALLYQRLVEVMEARQASFEILFVEDGGQDNSWQGIQTLVEADDRVTGLQLMRNYGQGAATMCGLRHSRGEVVITIDDDLQNPPEEIPALLTALEENPDLDVVIGVPREKKHAAWRRWGSEAIQAIDSYALEKERTIRFAGFRAIRRQVVDLLVELDMPQPAIGALLYSITPRMANVYVRHEPRLVGKSGYTLSKILTLSLSNFMGFSVFPLRFLALLGALGILASVTIGAVYLVLYLMGRIGVPGWTSLILLLSATAGFQFFAFGLVGEYLLRILQSVQNTRQYVLRCRIGPGEGRRDASG